MPPATTSKNKSKPQRILSPPHKQPQSTINQSQTHHKKTTQKSPTPHENRNLHHRQYLVPKTPHPDRFLPVSLRRIHVWRVYTCRNMSSSTISSGISADEFQALEQKVPRAAEIVKREREARAAAEAEVASLREQLAVYQSNTRAVEAELNTLNKERDAVRLR